MIAVSICCLAYNQEKLITDAIKGFMMQRTKFNYEIIIHDDASTDRTPEIIRKYQRSYPKLIKPILQTKNQFSRDGVYPFWTHLYPAAQGRYIAECDGDDYWTDPYKLQRQYEFMEANPEYAICYHNYVIKNMQTGKTLQQPFSPQDYTGEELISYRQRGHYDIHTSTKFWRNLWLDHPQSRALFSKFSADYPTTILQGMFGAGKYLDNIKPSVFRRCHTASSWTNLPPAQMHKKTREMYYRIYEAIKDTGNEDWINARLKFING